MSKFYCNDDNEVFLWENVSWDWLLESVAVLSRNRAFFEWLCPSCYRLTRDLPMQKPNYCITRTSFLSKMHSRMATWQIIRKFSMSNWIFLGQESDMHLMQRCLFYELFKPGFLNSHHRGGAGGGGAERNIVHRLAFYSSRPSCPADPKNFYRGFGVVNQLTKEWTVLAWVCRLSTSIND